MTSNLNPLFRATGAELRALAAQGNAEAQAEIARRAAKTPTTIAALRSRGMTAEAQARIAAAKAKKAADKPTVTRSEHPIAKRTEARVYHRTNERDSLAKVRADFGGRITAVENATLALAELAKTQQAVLAQLTARRTKKAV